MPALITEITLDLSRQNKNPIYAKQSDAGSRFFKVTLTNNGVKYTVIPATTVTLNVLKNDDTVASTAGIVSEDGTVTVPLSNQQLAKQDDNFMDISLTGTDETTLKTMRVILRVDPECVPDGTVISSDDFTALQTALAQVADFAGVKSEVQLARGTYASVLEHINSKINKADIVNDLTTGGATKVASAETVKGLETSKVAKTRKVNNKALDADITLTGADILATGYAEGTDAPVAATDTLNGAVGKLQAQTNTLKDRAIKKYGVQFSTGANPGTRLYDAAGLVANVGTDIATATNNFDSIYPWSARRRCCGTFDAAGNFVVKAYKGEPGYAEDGTNGEVWVEHSLFFYKHTYNGDAEEIVISAIQLPGYLPAPIFINTDGTLRQKAYTAAYPMATVGGMATSRSGVFSDICSLNSAMVTARTLGANYTTQTTAEWYTECLYMWAEFATRNLQSIMNSASGMPYDATHTAVIAETAVNRIIITNAKAAAYVVGQTILIGTSLGSSNVANNRVVTAIEVYDADNKAITFDGAAVNIAVGNIVCTAAYKNGSCDGVLSSSGSPVSNTDGKHNCIYRGEETPYGNAYETISDVLFKREGAGTVESPYTYDIYFLADPTKYNAGTITSDYAKLNFNPPAVDGYATKLGIDSRFPFLRVPSQIGAGSTTYYSDYYYYPRDAISAARVGGNWLNGSDAGPCYWRCNNTPSRSDVDYRARLSFHRS